MVIPEYYPLTLNALTNACNRKTNREPVESYDEVRDSLAGLEEMDLVKKLPLQPDRKEARYGHLLGGEQEESGDNTVYNPTTDITPGSHAENLIGGCKRRLTRCTGNFPPSDCSSNNQQGLLIRLSLDLSCLNNSRLFLKSSRCFSSSDVSTQGALEMFPR